MRSLAYIALSLGCAALLSACATPSGGPAETEVQPGTLADPRGPSHARIIPPGPNFATAAAPAQPASPPLDATKLPPFDGEKREVREPLRGLPTVDRTVQHDDLWRRIRDGFGMTNIDGPIVQERTAWYAARPEYLRRTFERSKRYLYHIVDELEKRGMPTELALLPMVESSFNPMAYSPAHASGLWQFIPGTGKRYDLAQNWWYDGRRDIVASTSAALDYLKDIYEMHGDWHLALASYNWGEHAVARAIERNKAAGQPTDYSSLRMPEETRHYVPKLQALKNIIANPGPFGVILDPIPNQPYFATITKTRDIDVKLAAQLAEMPLEEFIALNPGFNRPIIPVAVSSRIVLPTDRVEVFHANLLKYDKALVSWQTYTPKPGEKLEAIAKRFNVTVARLRDANGMNGRNAKGMPALLVVPGSGASFDSVRMPTLFAPPVPVARNSGPQQVNTRSVTTFHTVKAGDTLTSIASRYQVSVDDLRRWNQVGRLNVGQQIKVQSGVPVAGTPATAQGTKKSQQIKGKSKASAAMKPAKKSVR